MNFQKVPEGRPLRMAVIGAGNRAEIWNPAAYEDDIGAMASDEVEAEFMELGF